MINRYTLLPLAIVPATYISATEAADTTDTTIQPPNIVLFLVDDMGWQDTSVPFWSERTPLNERYNTPNMERLASMGVRFTQAYASSVSSPTRCSLMTGANAARHCVTNWTFKYNTKTDHPDNDIEIPDWNVNGIQPVSGIEKSFHATSFVQILKNNGYHTIHCGKAHFGATQTPAENPEALGFDVNIAGFAGGGPASFLGTERFGHDANGKAYSRFSIPGLQEYWDKDIYLTEALTQEAINAMQTAKSLSTPFFLYMSHYAVHVPITADKRFIEKYRQMGLSETEAAYASMVEGMDKSLGDIMNFLKEQDELNNTIIIFMSDNGGLSAEGRTPPLHVHNAPLRSGKGSAYEGGIREPMIIYWNGVTTPGSIEDNYVIIEDFFPTILEMAGVKEYETVQTIDGKSIVPILKGKETDSAKRPLVWNMPNNWIPGDNSSHGIGSTAAIRLGDYKLIYWYKTGSKELYNLSKDIGERNNLAKEKPEIVEKLSKELGSYLRSVGAQRPTFKNSKQPCPWPDEI